jgi:replicative DNA helicase
MAASTTGHAVIEVRPGWREPLNLYTVTVANPGERKSAVQGALCAPLLDVEQQLSTAGTAIRNEATPQKQIATMAADKAKESAAKAAGTDQWASTMSDAQSAQAMADSITIPEIPQRRLPVHFARSVVRVCA